jgi:hypothetical protein
MDDLHTALASHLTCSRLALSKDAVIEIGALTVSCKSRFIKLIRPALCYINNISVRFFAETKSYPVPDWYLVFDAHYKDDVHLIGLRVRISIYTAGKLVNSMPTWLRYANSAYVWFRNGWRRPRHLEIKDDTNFEVFKKTKFAPHDVITTIWLTSSLCHQVRREPPYDPLPPETSESGEDFFRFIARHEDIAQDVVIDSLQFLFPKDNRERIQRIFDAAREHRAPINA